MREMTNDKKLNSVCFGGASLDVFAPMGNIGPDHQPGKKVGWTAQDDERLREYRDDSSIDQHVGGNAFNVAAYFSRQSENEQTAFAGMLGSNDFITDAITSQMSYLRIKNESKFDARFSPSVSIIERSRRDDGTAGDRMVRGRPRGPQEIATNAFTETVIENIAFRADIVAVASMKNFVLTCRVFEESNGNAFKSWNPGSDEFDDAKTIRDYLHQKRSSINLLALNEEELAKLLDEDTAPQTSSQAKRLLERASTRRLSEAAIVCTLGKNGLLLAKSDTIFSQPIAELPENHTVVDTLGAGDRAHAVTAYGLALGRDPQAILEEAARSATHVICHEGAHGDLDCNIMRRQSFYNR